MARRERVRDHVADRQPQRREFLTLGAPDAGSTGGISAGSDPQQVVFELGAILAEANLAAVPPPRQHDYRPRPRRYRLVCRRL
jgi:hypothetical protein